MARDARITIRMAAAGRKAIKDLAESSKTNEAHAARTLLGLALASPEIRSLAKIKMEKEANPNV